jgi:DNA-binding NarL/FixJ family response regulator
VDLVPGLRAVLVALPPFLADIIRRVLTIRAGLLIIAEIANPEGAIQRLRELAPDVVVVGPAGAARRLDVAAIRATLPQARVLALSEDLTRLLGPDEDEIAEFTADALVERLRRPTI